MKEGYITLENGLSFKGEVDLWQDEPVSGEVVFNTGMTGYVESITDPSYAGQILLFTYPLVGNYGVFDPSFWESQRIYLGGIVINETTENWSHFKGLYSLRKWLTQEKVALITGVDTRALTKVLRTEGTCLGVISKEKRSVSTTRMVMPSVSVTEIAHYGKGKKRVILVDCGMKQNILRSLLTFDLQVVRVPATYDYTNEEYDGVFYSNGPGDPVTYQESITIMKRAMAKKKPIYGICLGSQLMALAAGASTYKLKFGHRGQNQPCIEVASRRCYITSQNHGFAVDELTLSSEWQVTFRNLNDQSVEGIAHTTLPFASVQFHPEAAPGPTDTQWFFERFVQCL